MRDASWKYKAMIILGGLVVVVPFLGFPDLIIRMILFPSGVLVILFSWLLLIRSKSHGSYCEPREGSILYKKEHEEKVVSSSAEEKKVKI